MPPRRPPQTMPWLPPPRRDSHGGAAARATLAEAGAGLGLMAGTRSFSTRGAADRPRFSPVGVIVSVAVALNPAPRAP